MAQRILSPAAMIGMAWDVAQQAHHGQMYGDEPYFHHPFEAANLARCMGYPLEIQAASLLHDTVEDTGVTLESLRQKGFSESVVRGVGAVTFIDIIDNPDGLTDFKRQTLKVNKAKSNPVGHVIKFVDSSVNLASTASLPWLLPNSEIVGEYLMEYASNLVLLKENLPSPHDIQVYIQELEGSSNNQEGLAVGHRLIAQEDWAHMERRIMRTRLRLAKYAVRSASDIEWAKNQ